MVFGFMSLEEEVDKLTRRVSELEGAVEFKRHDHDRIELLTREVSQMQDELKELQHRLKQAAETLGNPADSEDGPTPFFSD